MDNNILTKAKEWINDYFDIDTRNEIKKLIDDNNEKELIDRFYKELEFGTGGIRGVIGAGLNRMNRYIVRKATQGVANYILKKGDKNKGVVIGRDSRIMSDIFAQETASVLISNGIKVYFYNDIHPTPMVSFAVRHLNAQAGIVITASHNPKEYNGYKVMWDDGCQVTPPIDEEIINEVKSIKNFNEIKYCSFETAKASENFQFIDEIIDPVYLDKIKSIIFNPDIIKNSDIKIVYSPLHGTGYKIIPQALNLIGFKNILIEPEQSKPDGNFPSAPSPNPEEKDAMYKGIEFAKLNNADIFIASDPDADRIGVALKNNNGDFILLNGNQIATLLAYYIITQRKEKNILPNNPRLIKTIVTTELLRKISEKDNVVVDDVLTGFKWIGLKIKEYEKKGYNFIFGCEESHGVLAADFVRDKDAVMGTVLLAEMAAYYKNKNLLLIEVLYEIYKEYGYFAESQKSITMKGIEGMNKINSIMNKLRTNPPYKLGNYNLIRLTDVLENKIFDTKENKSIGKTDLPKSDVIILEFDSEAKIVCRPSGTEPKIKFYFTNYNKIKNNQSISEVINNTNNEQTELINLFLNYLELK